MGIVRGNHVGRVALIAIAAVVLFACSSSKSTPSTSGSAPGATQPSANKTLHVLVTNDDGVAAPGIDALVEGLRKVPDTQVTVVAPATNQSGTGGKTTPGTLTVTDAKTASGYAAKAVAGFPADTIVWAIDQHGVTQRPDVVLSGVNFGQNLGPVVDISGTVGAARAAASRGIPALATSAGIPPPGVATPDYAGAVTRVLAWVQQHRADLISGKDRSPVLLQNFNEPTCATGTKVKDEVDVPIATSLQGHGALDPADCTSSATSPADDVAAFYTGYAPLSDLSVQPATTTTTAAP